jgi:hypothetical protein
MSQRAPLGLAEPIISNDCITAERSFPVFIRSEPATSAKLPPAALTKSWASV